MLASAFVIPLLVLGMIDLVDLRAYRIKLRRRWLWPTLANSWVVVGGTQCSGERSRVSSNMLLCSLSRRTLIDVSS